VFFGRNLIFLNNYDSLTFKIGSRPRQFERLRAGEDDSDHASTSRNIGNLKAKSSQQFRTRLALLKSDNIAIFFTSESVRVSRRSHCGELVNTIFKKGFARTVEV